jgi:4-amino-4-deoxy-L-arabinose transferase-like glycosyltransferase
LFFPYGVIASRSFQPDPLMVMLILSFWWAVNRWVEDRAWKWALLAGLLGGAAIFIKFVAAFFVIGGALGAALGRMRLSELFRSRQAWGMAVLGILPGAAYLFYGIVLRGFLGQQFSGRFIPALLFSPLNYVQWAEQAAMAAGGIAIMLGLLGFFFASGPRLRIFLAGLWGAYLLYGLFFDYHVATHDYYHLPLIPIVAVSLAPVLGRFTGDLAKGAARPWAKAALLAILLYGLLVPVWSVRSELKSADYRPQAAMWAGIGDLLGRDGRVVGLTEDYGAALNYWGWHALSAWPSSGDLSYHSLRGKSSEFAKLFDSLTAKRDYFLVTDFDQLNLQPELKEALYSYFAIYAQGEGYVIFDLNRPLR